MIGPGKPFDTDRFHVVCTNLLGGCRGTTGPGSTNPQTGRPYGSAFPVDHGRRHGPRAAAPSSTSSGSSALLCVTGALARRHAGAPVDDRLSRRRRPLPRDRDDRRTSTRAGVALNAVARNAIMADPDWQGGDYYGTGRAPDAGMAVARQIGHITYLSRHAFAREVRPPRCRSATTSRTRWREPDFAVESYLRHQGEALRRALRREHVPRHLARAHLLRPRPGAARSRRARARASRCSRSRPTGCTRRRTREELRRRRCAARGPRGRARLPRDDLRPRLVPARGGGAGAAHRGRARAGARPAAAACLS